MPSCIKSTLESQTRCSTQPARNDFQALDLYLKDQEDSKGEVGKVDFDPLYDFQDFEISGFNMDVLPKKKGYVAA